MAMCELVQTSSIAPPVIRPTIHGAIDALGTVDFGTALLDYLTDMFGVEHCVIYIRSGDQLINMAAASPGRALVAERQSTLYVRENYWREDPGLDPFRAANDGHPPLLARIDVNRLDHGGLRDRIFRPYGVLDRVLLGQIVDDCDVILSMTRTVNVGYFSEENLESLTRIAGSLIRIVAKHVLMMRSMPRMADALTSLPAIERCISMSDTRLARREAEVCARILYGMTSPGIALDLNIGEESAMTYRKRAYQRLRIGSQRELLLWYLAEWTRYDGAAFLHVNQRAA